MAVIVTATALGAGLLAGGLDVSGAGRRFNVLARIFRSAAPLIDNLHHLVGTRSVSR